MTSKDKPNISACHMSPVKLVGGRGDFSDHEEGITMHYECTVDNQPCDLYVDSKPDGNLSQLKPTLTDFDQADETDDELDWLDGWKPIFVNGVIPTEFKAALQRWKERAVREALLRQRAYDERELVIPARIDELNQLEFHGHGNDKQTLAAIHTHYLLRKAELQSEDNEGGETKS